MTRIEYIRALHDLMYQANKADAPDIREDFQEARHASDHVNKLDEVLCDVLTSEERNVFGDCFGDFDSFVAEMKRRSEDDEDEDETLVIAA